MTPSPPLRAVTYLAPSIPLGFFEGITRYLAREMGRSIELETRTRSSGPMHGDDDPFAAQQADIGFLCAPSFLYLRSQDRPSVQLVPAGFVFEDPRHSGEPVYYSDLVVRKDHEARGLLDLEGAVWGFNDECSLSGYFATLQQLREIGRNGTFFADRVRTGSHLASIDATLPRSRVRRTTSLHHGSPGRPLAKATPQIRR